MLWRTVPVDLHVPPDARLSHGEKLMEHIELLEQIEAVMGIAKNDMKDGDPKYAIQIHTEKRVVRSWFVLKR